MAGTLTLSSETKGLLTTKDKIIQRIFLKQAIAGDSAIVSNRFGGAREAFTNTYNVDFAREIKKIKNITLYSNLSGMVTKSIYYTPTPTFLGSSYEPFADSCTVETKFIFDAKNEQHISHKNSHSSSLYLEGFEFNKLTLQWELYVKPRFIAGTYINLVHERSYAYAGDLTQIIAIEYGKD